MFTIEYAEGVVTDLKSMRIYERTRILDSIEAQLGNEPAKQTRNRKMIVGRSRYAAELATLTGLGDTGYDWR